MYKCKICRTKRPKEQMWQPPGSLQYICHPQAISPDCALQLSQENLKKQKEQKDKEFRKETRRRKEAARGRLDYYKTLGALVNQYAKHVHYKGEPCYTCGKKQSNSDSCHSFHAGHYMAAKRVDPRRFMLENLRIQCYSCNVANSGRGAEYRKRLIEEKGEDFVLWLEAESNHKSLKKQFPEISDIQAEIERYRSLLRENGLTPRRG